MKDNSFIFIFLGIIIGGTSLAFTIDYVYGAGTITVDNSGRREYGYCPINPELLSSRAELEINGCPLIRTYITNWDKLTILEQQTIDTELRGLGFKDISEFDNRVK